MRSLSAAVEPALLPRLPAEGGRVSHAPQDLPEHMGDSGEWKAWPRKLDAHLKWGVRQRQIEAYTRNGRLKVWHCPDGTYRLDPGELRELFGEPDVVQGRDRDLSAKDRKRKQTDAELASDPLALMFAKAVEGMGEHQQAAIGLLKLIPDSMKVLLGSYETALKAQAERIRVLEAQVDAAAALHSELTDAAQERDVSLKRFESSEKRKDETLTLLKDQLPSLVSTWLAGDSLSGFAKRSPRDVVEAVVASGSIAEQDAEIMRKAAGIPKPAPETPNQANGETDNGNS